MTPTRSIQYCGTAVLLGVIANTSASAHTAPPPDWFFAQSVVDYEQGANPVPGYTNPNVALGPPSRFTPDEMYPGVVSPFQSAWKPEQIVSIGAGGSLVLEFDPPIVADTRHPFDVALIVFGNSFFLDSNWPNGIVGGLIAEGGTIEISNDGETWIVIEGVESSGLYPTLGYLDAWAYDAEPGEIPSVFTRPVDPSLDMSNFMGKSHWDVVDLYAGSGGGIGIDIAAAGLDEVKFVRIANPPDAQQSVEVDAVARVAIPGDINHDGQVNGADLGLLLANWGPVSDEVSAIADLNGDGVVDGADLGILLANWSQ